MYFIFNNLKRGKRKIKTRKGNVWEIIIYI